MVARKRGPGHRQSHEHPYESNPSIKTRRIIFSYGLDLFLTGRCVRTDAATLLTLADVFGLRKSALAIFPTLFDVFSFLANWHLLA